LTAAIVAANGFPGTEGLLSVVVVDKLLCGIGGLQIVIAIEKWNVNFLNTQELKELNKGNTVVCIIKCWPKSCFQKTPTLFDCFQKQISL
jgi:hypothetical protein